MKYIITEQQHNKIIDKFITFQFEPHEVEEPEKYPGTFFWTKNGELILAGDTKKNNLWISPLTWETINTMFDMEGDDAKHAIIQWLENHYGFADIDIYTS
jgi:hypothetical protein